MMRGTGTAWSWAEARVPELVDSLVRDASVLEIDAAPGPCGSHVIDCGVAVRGSWEVGRRLAVLSHAGMMSATLGVCEVAGLSFAELTCDSWRPALSTVGLQVSFALSEVDAAIRISGPIRAAVDGVRRPGRGLAGRLRGGWRNPSPWGVAIVESDCLPDSDVVGALARRAGIHPRKLTLFVVPTHSLAGVAQIGGRLNECVLFTLEQSLGLNPAHVVGIVGSVPLAPCGAGAVLAEDDMIHYAGRVVMIVDAPAEWELNALAESLVFQSSPAYGRLFSELLSEAGGVFERIPGLTDLNKVAQISILDRRTGRSASAGASAEAVLETALARKGATDAAR